MALDDEQLALLDEWWKDGAFPEWGASAKPTPGQTIDQQKNFGISSFQYVCQFLGIEIPSEEDVREELRARSGQ